MTISVVLYSLKVVASLNVRSVVNKDGDVMGNEIYEFVAFICIICLLSKSPTVAHSHSLI